MKTRTNTRPRKRNTPWLCQASNQRKRSLFVESLESRWVLSTIFVDVDSPDATPDGLSWSTAYTDLQDGLAAANSGDEIWVAEGTYKPDRDSGNRAMSFNLKSGVDLYGGFAGTETTRDQRDWTTCVTRLNGDIGTEGVASDNSYHVVYASGVSNATLDGFTVIAGNASHWSYPNYLGGGVYVADSSPTLAFSNLKLRDNSTVHFGGGMYVARSDPSLMNVAFVQNHADWGGAGLFNENSSPSLSDATFDQNTADRVGGGMHNDHGSSPVLTNVTFKNNSSGWEGGGGMGNFQSSPILTNVVFFGNSSVDYGGAIWNRYSSPALTNVTFSGNFSANARAIWSDSSSSPTVTNSIFWDISPSVVPQIYDDWGSSTDVTYSIVEGGRTGVGNLDANPLFVDAANGDLRLLPASPAIDAGDNTAVPADVYDLDGDGDTTEPIPFDLDRLPRFFDVAGVPDTGVGTSPIIDMGAYEGHNQPPEADDQLVAVAEDAAQLITLSASDADEDDLTFVIVSDPEYGTLTDFDAVYGTVTYEPDPDYHGSDWFTFKVNDGTADSNVATISITVDADADIVADEIEINEDMAVTFHVSKLLENDNFEDADAYVSAVTQASNGSVEIEWDENETYVTNVTYTPNADFNGSDSFAYTVTTHVVGPANTETATVYVTVLSPDEQIDKLVTEILGWLDDGYINGGQSNSLQTKLDGALAKLAGNDFSVAVNKLEAFINQIDALIQSGHVSATEGNPLIASVEALIHSIETEAEEDVDAVFANLEDDLLLDPLGDALLDELASAI